MMNSPDHSSVSLRDLSAVLVRWRSLILITFILGLAGVVAVTSMTPRQYEARMKILVKNERPDMIVSADRSESSGYRSEIGEAQINSEIELLSSNDLLRQVVGKCGLEHLERADAALPSERPSVMFERALAHLSHALKISPVKKSNIILVEYTASDPQRIVTVLQQLAELYLEFHLRVHGTPGTYEFFKSQAARYEHELEDGNAKLAEFRHRENIIMLDQQRDMLLRKTSDSESALAQTEAAASEYTQKIANTRKQLLAAQPRVETQSRTGPNQYSVERLSTMVVELQNRRTQLLAKFRPDDRLVQETDQELADTQAALEKAMKLTGAEHTTDVNPVYQGLDIDLAKQEIELTGLEARRRSLAQQTKAYGQQLLKLSNAAASYDELVRNQKDAGDNYLLYAKKAEEARITESLDQQKIANVAIAEAPIEPHLPSKPNVRMNLALGVLLCCFISLGGALAAEYFRGTVAQPSELEELTGLPVLAVAERL